MGWDWSPALSWHVYFGTFNLAGLFGHDLKSPGIPSLATRAAVPQQARRKDDHALPRSIALDDARGEADAASPSGARAHNTGIGRFPPEEEAQSRTL